MNVKQANMIPIANYLEVKGIGPEKKNKTYSMYKAPYREDRTASLKVSHLENLWVDYGEENNGGTLIDLVLRINPNFNVSEAMKDIHQTINSFFSFHKQNIDQSESTVENPNERFDNRQSTIEMRHSTIETRQLSLETQNEKNALPVSKREKPVTENETPKTKIVFGNSRQQTSNSNLQTANNSPLLAEPEIAKSYNGNPDNLKSQNQKINRGSINSYYLKDVGNNPAITNYLNERGIQVKTASPFCKEIYYQINGKKYFGLANKNHLGWSIRNKYWKGCTSQGYSYYPNGSKFIHVFEGIFDLLSYVELHQREKIKSDFIVLNSLVNFKQAITILNRYQSINLYLDHDEAGRKATQFLQEHFPTAVDQSSFYKSYKDLNDYLLIKVKGKMVNEEEHLKKENQ